MNKPLTLRRIVAALLGVAALSAQAYATTNSFSLGLNFGPDQLLEDYATAGSLSALEPDEAAGVPTLPATGNPTGIQKNWNNVLDATSGNGFSGAYATPAMMTDLVGDDRGTAVPTTASVTWQANGTWSTSGSRGAAETNGWRFMTSSPADHKLMNGYLDTSAAGNPTLITVSNLPTQLTGSGYHVVVYMNGAARANRGGSVRLIDADSGLPLTPYLLYTTLQDPQTHTRDIGANHTDTGTYVIFTNLASPNIRVESTIAVNPNNATPRAPVNALQFINANLSEPIVGAASANGQFAYLTITDLSSSQVDTTSVEVKVGGQTIPVQVSKSGIATTIVYDNLATTGQFFTAGATITATLNFKDTTGRAFTADRTFTVAGHTTLNEAFALSAADTTKPGFRAQIYQMEVPRGPAAVSFNTGINAVPEAERQLARGYIDPATKAPYENTADLSGAVNGWFDIPGPLNLNQDAGNAGFFSAGTTPAVADTVIPGLPGTAVNATDNIVGEYIAYLELTPGLYRFGVNSDDGFQFSIGRTPNDLRGQIISSRGANGNTTFDVSVTKAGFYPMRLLWWEGNGGANLEFYRADLANGALTLINDGSANSVKAYREAAKTYPWVSKILPFAGQANIVPTADVTVELTDGTVPADAGSAKLTINGVDIPSTRVGNVTRFTRAGSLQNLLPGGANTAVLAYKFTDGTTTVDVSHSWTFTVGGTTGALFGPAYVTIPAGNRVPASSVNDATGGFKVLRAHQIDRTGDANQGNGGRYPGQGGDANAMPRPEIQLNNGYIHPNGNPYTNLISAVGANEDGSYDLYEPLNINVLNTINTGAFNGGSYPDSRAPGMPGAGTSQAGQDNAVYEIVSYLDLKAGAYLVSVNSDDGFLLSSAPNPRDTLGTLVGMWNTGGGSANPASRFVCFVITEDGIYPFRLLYWQGGGGGNLEWSHIDYPSGRSVLINDALTDYAIKAYGSYTGPARPWVKFSIYPMPLIFQNQHQQTRPGPIEVRIPGGNAVDYANDGPTTRAFADGFGAVMADLGGTTPQALLNGQPVDVTLTPSGADTTVLYKPATPLPSGSTNTASLIYAGVTNSWTFAVQTYATVAAGVAKPVSAADEADRGFRVKVVQSASARGSGNNTVAGAEAHLAGTPANILPPDPVIVQGPINWNVNKAPGGSGAENGGFTTALNGTTDTAVPLIPGPGLSGAARFENVTAEIFAYLDLPAGYQRFGIGGDDGWAVRIGTPGQTDGQVLFTTDRATGARDIPFSFFVPEAGLYPIRLVWYQGGGGGNIEFFTYGNNNDKILVNSATPGAIKAYSEITEASTPALGIARNADGTLSITFEGQLQSTESLSAPNWQPVAGATSPASVTPTGGSRFYRAVR